MDGTLINSEDIYIKQLNSILASFNKEPLSKDLIAKIQGRPGAKICEIIVEERGLGDTISGQEFYAITNEPKLLSVYKETAFLPGIKEFLRHLKYTHNVPMSIATSTTKLKYDAKTQHLQNDGFDMFEVVLTGGDQPSLKGRGKPEPHIWHMALDMTNERLGVKGTDKEIKIEECLIFEDSVSGIKSAIRLGGKGVFIPSNPDAVKALPQNELNWILENSEAVLDSFEAFDASKYGWSR